MRKWLSYLFKPLLVRVIQWLEKVDKPQSPLMGENVKTILLSFPDDKTRDRYLQLIKATADLMLAPENVEKSETTKRDGEIIKAALGTIKLDPPIKQDHERIVAIFVTGQKMAEGTLTAMRLRFQQEIGSHSGSVELRELREGEWVTIQARRKQQLQSPA